MEPKVKAWCMPLLFNDYGEVVGVWYNFASWLEVTNGIRKEAEDNLLKEHEGSFIVMTKHVMFFYWLPSPFI